MVRNYVENEVYRGDEFTGLQLSFFYSQMELHATQSTTYSFEYFRMHSSSGQIIFVALLWYNYRLNIQKSAKSTRNISAQNEQIPSRAFSYLTFLRWNSICSANSTSQRLNIYSAQRIVANEKRSTSSLFFLSRSLRMSSRHRAWKRQFHENYIHLHLLPDEGA